MKTKIAAIIIAASVILGTGAPVASAAWGDEGASVYKCSYNWAGQRVCYWR